MNRFATILFFLCCTAFLIAELPLGASSLGLPSTHSAKPGTPHYIRTANPPENVNITITNGILTISWDPVPAAIGYTIEESSLPDSGFVDVSASGVFQSLTGLVMWTKPADQYREFFRIRTQTGIPSDLLLVVGGYLNTRTGFVEVPSFYMNKYEVRQSEYEAVMGFNPSFFSGNANNPV